MKIKFDLNWKTIYGFILISLNVWFFVYWYYIKSEYIEDLTMYIAYPFYSEPFGTFFSLLVLLCILIPLSFFPFIIAWVLIGTFPFKESKENSEIKKATKEIKDKYKKIELERKLKELKKKQVR